MSTDRFGNDERLLDALSAGDPAAIEELFAKYQGRIYALAMSVVKNDADAQEATQDVFMTVVRKASTFSRNSALYSWMYRICVNTCLMRLRSKRGKEMVSIEEFLPVFTEDGLHSRAPEDWSGTVERKMLDRELGDVIKSFAGELPEKYRVVFQMSDIDELTNEEVGKVLGLSVPAVKSRLHRARLYLRGRLDGYLREGRTAKV